MTQTLLIKTDILGEKNGKLLICFFNDVITQMKILIKKNRNILIKKSLKNLDVDNNASKPWALNCIKISQTV